MDKPIINSKLDLDKYKLTMCKAVHDLHPDVDVTYTFNNRTTSIPLAKYIDVNELVDQIRHIISLRFTYEELTYLKSQPEFDIEFINFLSTMNHNIDFEVIPFQGQIHLQFHGKWETAILYETLFLSLINEMFGRNIKRALDRPDFNADRCNKLLEKMKILKDYPDIKFIEFGTRRRHSFDWHKEVIQICIDHGTCNFVGTSNYLMAKEFDVKAIGTVAHEWFMVRAALDCGYSCQPPRDTQQKSIKAWLDYFGKPLSIILTDTFGTNAFLKDFTKEYAKFANGVRQDSGDPIQLGNRMIKFYKDFGIDPKTKTVVFSDGLDVSTIIRIYKEFKGKIQMVFGWGTNLTNDVGIKPLSIVIKATEANGQTTVKLSDNICKAIGEADLVTRYIELFKPTQTEVKTVY